MQVIGPIDKIRCDAIGNRDVIANDESTPFEVKVENRGHSEKLFLRQCNIRLQTLILGIKRRVFADPPEWLLQLCDRKLIIQR
jgi:hypothetical protein